MKIQEGILFTMCQPFCADLNVLTAECMQTTYLFLGCEDNIHEIHILWGIVLCPFDDLKKKNK